MQTLLEKEKLNYKDITKEWLKDVGNEQGSCQCQNYFLDKNKVIHKLSKYVILDHSYSELRIAKWFSNVKKIDILLLPRVIYPKRIKSGDFIEKTTGIVWEIKEPIGNTIGTTMLNQFKGQKDKASNFIIDISKCNIDIKDIIIDIENILNNNRYSWINTVILINKNKLIKVFSR